MRPSAASAQAAWDGPPPRTSARLATPATSSDRATSRRVLLEPPRLPELSVTDKPRNWRCIPEALLLLVAMAAFGVAAWYLSDAVRRHLGSSHLRWFFNYQGFVIGGVMLVNAWWTLSRDRRAEGKIDASEALIRSNPTAESAHRLPRAAMTRWWPLGSGYTTSLLLAAARELMGDTLATTRQLGVTKSIARRAPPQRHARQTTLIFVADTGDGYQSTRAVADTVVWLCNQFACGGEVTTCSGGRKRSVLILGGDLVYPAPNRVQYARRFCKPFSAALRNLQQSNGQASDAVTLPFLAVPGNHDHYDNLDGFESLMNRHPWYCPKQMEPLNTSTSFIYHERVGEGAGDAPAVLTVFGLDGGILGDITGESPPSPHLSLVPLCHRPRLSLLPLSAKQFESFSAAVDAADPLTRFIVVTHVPFWLKAGDRPHLEALMDRLYSDVHGRLALVLAGDLHVYHACVLRGVAHVVCGGGGAFSHLTHHYSVVKSALVDTSDPPGPAGWLHGCCVCGGGGKERACVCVCHPVCRCARRSAMCQLADCGAVCRIL